MGYKNWMHHYKIHQDNTDISRAILQRSIEQKESTDISDNIFRKYECERHGKPFDPYHLNRQSVVKLHRTMK